MAGKKGGRGGSRKKDDHEDTDTGHAPEGRSAQAPTKGTLNSLLTTARSTRQRTTELAGVFGSEMKEAVEKKHVNRKAFSILKGLDRLEPEVLNEVLGHLDYYLDVTGIRERAESVGKLDLVGGSTGKKAADKAKPEEDDEGANGGGKKRGSSPSLRVAGGRDVSESAGETTH